MTNTSTLTSDGGKAAALVVYVLYLLSIPSAGILALVGVMVALICRENAAGVWRAHLNDQVRVWAIAFMWWVALFAIWLLGVALTLVLIGFPIIWLVGAAGFAVMLWFTVKSVLGLLALLDGRAP